MLCHLKVRELAQSLSHPPIQLDCLSSLNPARSCCSGDLDKPGSPPHLARVSAPPAMHGASAVQRYLSRSSGSVPPSPRVTTPRAAGSEALPCCVQRMWQCCEACQGRHCTWEFDSQA